MVVIIELRLGANSMVGFAKVSKYNSDSQGAKQRRLQGLGIYVVYLVILNINDDGRNQNYSRMSCKQFLSFKSSQQLGSWNR